jgi:primary-amine oxidase
MDFGLSIAKNLSDITEDLLGASVNLDRPDDPHGLLCWPRGSRVERGGLSLWFQMFKPGVGSGAKTLLPQGIYAKVDATSTNINDWTAGELYYNGVLYDSENDLRAVLQSGDLARTPRNMDGSWTDTEDFDAEPPGRELPPPVSVQPHGARYRLDREQQFVSWFGFEFYIATAQATGLTLFDIRFKGERVMYELGLQEALAHYAGDDPMQGGLEFLDSFFGMGKSMYELVPGYDCPAYADYLDSRYYQAHQTFELPNGICLFEYTADHLLSRHTAQYSVTASRNTYLVLRSVSTVGNYDYTIEYIFYLDGSLEVKVRASGFIFGAFYSTNPSKNEDEYGHRIQTALSSSMHDHVINFKADLDIAGPTNDMVRLALEPITVSYPWDAPEVEERNTMHLVEYGINEETGLDWPRNSGELYLVYSSDKTNAWGEKKGYRITSGMSLPWMVRAVSLTFATGTGMGNTPHLTIVNSTTLGDSARWAEHDIWVLQRKDTEPRSADPLNYFAPLDPLIDFNKMADHETLRHDGEDSAYDGDLVIYFNVGAHHIPHSGDIPNTLMHTSATSVMFVPHNFNDRDPSRESVQGVRLQLRGKNSGGFAGEPDVSDDLRNRMAARSSEKKHKVEYFGTPYEQGMKLPLEAFEPDLQKFKSSEIAVNDLSYNGSAAGVWMRDNV